MSIAYTYYNYTQPKRVAAGYWWYYPDLKIATNTHNGARAHIVDKPGNAYLWGVNIPAQWMLEELATFLRTNNYVENV